LSHDAAQQFGGAVFVVTAGLWPYAFPTEIVAIVSAEMGVEDSYERFRENFRDGLAAQLIGLAVQTQLA
jgi:hypothetical protein